MIVAGFVIITVLAFVSLRPPKRIKTVRGVAHYHTGAAILSTIALGVVIWLCVKYNLLK
jgi:hypothetical protein